jgi:hypothetical protein
MIEIIFWLLGLPLPALVTLIVALTCLVVVLLLLLAFVPHLAERVIAIIRAFHEK